MVRAIHGARLQAMELDRRLAERAGGQRGDLWFLLDPEVDDYLLDPAGHAALITERREQHRRLAERIPPFFFRGAAAAARRPGSSGATGRSRRPTRGPPSTGSARLPRGGPGPGPRGDPPRRPPGAWLPATSWSLPLTDPAWTPLFLTAEAVVVDVGALMSHAVIVSRELGIPCVVSATDASRRIPDGALIEVDGSAGTVTVLEDRTASSPSA